MKTKEERGQNIKKIPITNKVSFWKANWALLVLIFFAIIVIVALCYIALAPYLNKISLEKDIKNKQTTQLFSIEKILCYSSAYGTNNTETEARWNLNLSQFTDMAIYLNTQAEIDNMYIDNISFSNSSNDKFSLNSLAAEEFGKSPIDNIEIANTKKIEVTLANPIILRYSNNNLKKNCLITDIETPLSFDGSLLKRGKVTLSSLKNTITFNLNIIDSDKQEYFYPVRIDIPLGNNESDKSIYDGNYTEEIPFDNAKFYMK